MINNEINKPCLVQTTQGFSVSYQNKLLYSKYNPSKLILNKISDLSIPDGTIVLCFSPCLCYGLPELLSKKVNDCLFLACEIDEDLYDFTLTQPLITNLSTNPHNNFAFLTRQEFYNLPSILGKSSYQFSTGLNKPSPGNFKRILRIDFSAGTTFHEDFYNDIESLCIKSIKTFWTNRFTLTKFGKSYSTNLFRNLKNISKTIPIDSFFKKITKSIVVFGAGESSEKGILDIKNNRKDYFVICVDTSLQPLLQSGIEPDCVFVEEAQIVIQQAFIGTKKANFRIFSSISSTSSISENFDLSNISFFATEYVDSSFFSDLKSKSFFPFSIIPFGSVGLTAVFFALQFRFDQTIPVFIYGLDFLFSKGRTHQNGSYSHTNRLLSLNRLSSLDNFNSCFGETSVVINKEDKSFYSSKIMTSYSELFNNYFSNTVNLFKASDFGIPLNLKKSLPYITKESLHVDEVYSPKNEYKSEIDEYIKNETSILKKCEDLLSGKTNLKEQEITEQIFSFLSKREYLYLYFPDGWSFSTNLSFLKRVKSSIIYFLKILEN